MNNSIDQQFVEFVVKSLVSNPDAVQVERRIDEKGVLLELTVDPEDLGRVIGKRGATAQSLRTLLRALGTKNDARYNLKIVDNGVGGYSNGSDDHSTSTRDDSAAPAPAAKSSDEDEEVLSVSHEQESDVVSKTRKELEELDDLDV
ncbi:MAG: KH domain-containing protein [Candidatus Saccharimonadales bacterium]